MGSSLGWAWNDLISELCSSLYFDELELKIDFEASCVHWLQCLFIFPCSNCNRLMFQSWGFCSVKESCQSRLLYDWLGFCVQFPVSWSPVFCESAFEWRFVTLGCCVLVCWVWLIVSSVNNIPYSLKKKKLYCVVWFIQFSASMMLCDLF